MNVQGFQKMTLLDFPGKVACTVFTGGCNLRCPFCHNASLVTSPRLRENAQEEVLSYLEKRRGILDGVCVTGGEPLLQPDLLSFLRRVKEMGYQVKLDTNGSDPVRLSQILSSGLVDYVAMDVKSGPSHYAKAIGMARDPAIFLESISYLSKSGVPHEFRTTAVKGIHEEKDFEEIAKLLAGEERFFLQKFVDSGDLLGEGFQAFSEEQMQHFLEILRKTIPGAQLRGQEEIGE